MKTFHKDLIYFSSSVIATIIGWSITMLTITFVPLLSIFIRVSSGITIAVSIKHLLEHRLENKEFKIKNFNQFTTTYKYFIFTDAILLTIGWFISVIFLFLAGPFISLLIRLIYGITSGAFLFKYGKVNRSLRNRFILY